MEREGSLVRGPVSPPAPLAAGRPSRRSVDREPGQAPVAVSLGLLGTRDRFRSRQAEQVWPSPRRRHHGRRRIVRFPRRKSGARADRGSRGGGGAIDLAVDSGARGKFARSQSRQGRERGALHTRRRDDHRFDLALAYRRRKSRSPIRGWPTRSARPPNRVISGCRSRGSTKFTIARWCSTRSSLHPCWSAPPIRRSRAGWTG